MSVKAELAKANKLWDAAKKKKPSFDSVVTDGIYVGQMTKVELGESQSSGRLQVAWAVVIASGDFKGETVRWYSGLKTEDNMMYLQRDIARLGKECNGLDELDEICQELTKEKPMVRVKVSKDGEYTNVRLVKKLNKDEAPEPATSADAAQEEAAPAEEELTPEAEPEAELTAEEPAAEAGELEVGTRVSFALKGKDTIGEVLEIDYKTELVRVKTEDGPVYKVKLASLAPAPKTTVKKKK